MAIFGGTNGQCQINSLHIFFGQNNLWKEMPCNGNFPSPRVGAACVWINPFQLMVWGGNESLTFKDSDVYIYDMKNELWLKPKILGSPPSARSGHSCINLGDRALIFGGTNGLTKFNDLYEFHFGTLTWKKLYCTGNIPPGVEQHIAVFCQGAMIIFGGWIDSAIQIPRCTNDLYLLDLETLHWFKERRMIPSYRRNAVPRPRAGHCGFSFRNQVFVWGGRDGFKTLHGHQMCHRDLWYLDTEIPGTPGPLMIGRVSATQIELYWDHPVIGGSVTSYQLEMSKSDGMRFEKAYEGATPNYIVSNLVPNVLYRFRVFAINELGSSVPSPIIEVATLFGSKPSAPLKLSLDRGSQRQVNISWEPPMDIGGSLLLHYRVEISENGEFFEENATTELNTCKITGLNPDTEYFVRVAAVNQNGIGDYSPPMKIATAPTKGLISKRMVSATKAEAAEKRSLLLEKENEKLLKRIRQLEKENAMLRLIKFSKKSKNLKHRDTNYGSDGCNQLTNVENSNENEMDGGANADHNAISSNLSDNLKTFEVTLSPSSSGVEDSVGMLSNRALPNEMLENSY